MNHVIVPNRHAGAHVETRNAQKNTPLMLAAAAGHVSTVRDGARRRVCVLRYISLRCL
jgi:hypothetical protein